MSTPLPGRHCFGTSDVDPARPSIHFSASGVDLLRRNKSGGFVFKVSSRGTILPLSPKQEEEEEGEEEPTSLSPSSLHLPRVADSGALNLDRTLPAAQTQTQRHINSAHI